MTKDTRDAVSMVQTARSASKASEKFRQVKASGESKAFAAATASTSFALRRFADDNVLKVIDNLTRRQ